MDNKMKKSWISLGAIMVINTIVEYYPVGHPARASLLDDIDKIENKFSERLEKEYPPEEIETEVLANQKVAV